MIKAKKGKTIKPRKQRKRIVEAPLHKKKTQLTAHASKEVKKSTGKRSIKLRKGDKVKVMRGKYKGQEAKITKASLDKTRVFLEGINLKRVDGREKPVPFKASNLLVKELDKTDERRFKTR